MACDRSRDSFLMDFENACLSQHWDSSKNEHPKGVQRHLNLEWAAMIKTQVFPYRLDVTWDQYVEWVKEGGGDDWFQAKLVEESTRCSGCGRNDDHCRCGADGLWWGDGE